MDTQEEKLIGKGLSYNHLLADDKHYFGGFLNLAQNNINSLMQEFCIRLGLRYKKEHNAIIKEYFKKETSQTDWIRGVKLLREYLPLIDMIDLPITSKQFEALPDSEKELAKRNYFSDTLTMLFSAINSLRNYYSHYYHAPIILPENLFKFLNTALFKTIIDVKKIKMKDDKTRQLLKQTLKKQIEKLVLLKKEELKEKKKTNSRINTTDEKGILNAVYNDAFFHLLYTDKDTKEERLSKFYNSKLEEEAPIQLSTAGLIFLLSFFLNRKEVEDLKSNITGYKAKVLALEDVTKKDNGLKYMATHWVFSIRAFKGVKRRITSSFAEETFMMQIVDELNKVPDEVYQTLSENDKKTFLEDLNEYVNESDADDETPAYVVHPVIRKRYEDKFTYFAVRFLDEYANFPTLRFQIFAGLYTHDTRSKRIAGTETISERKIKERINIFGRMSEVQKSKSDYFAHNNEPEGWELFPNPSYNWVANNISVQIDLMHKGDKAKAIQIERKRLNKKSNPEGRDKRISKEKIFEQVFQKPISFGNPTLLLSKNELMSVLYEFLVNKKSGEELENHIVQKICERYDLLQEFTPDGDTKTASSLLPKRLLKSQASIEPFDDDKLFRAIEREVEQGQAKLQLIDAHRKELKEYENNRRQRTNDKAKKRKYLFYAAEMGEEATWIVNDLKRFMPIEARKEWKGYHHSELQRLIAFYPTHRSEAQQLLQSVWDMKAQSPDWNASFDATFQKKEFDNFYQAYLNVRNGILQNFIQNINSVKGISKQLKKVLDNVFIVFDKRLYQIKTTQKQKDELLAKPFVFPRGLFDEKPTVLPGSKPQTEPEKFADWYVYGYNYGGRCQQFYEMQREYTDLYRELGISKPLERFRIDCDMKIKRIRFQDTYLKLIVDRLFEDVFGQPLTLNLSGLYDTREERSFYAEKSLQQKNRETGDSSENIRNETYLWNKLTTVNLFDGRIIDEQVKLKDIGKFRRFITDPKVETLLSYDVEKVWCKQLLEDELGNKATSYESIRRHKLLRQVHQFEKLLLAKTDFDGTHHPECFSSAKGDPNFKMYVVNGILKKRRDISENDYRILLDTNFEKINMENVNKWKPLVQKAFLLIYLRNKFLHNQLPQQSHYLLMRQLFPDVSVQDSYSDYFNRIMEFILQEFCELEF